LRTWGREKESSRERGRGETDGEVYWEMRSEEEKRGDGWEKRGVVPIVVWLTWEKGVKELSRHVGGGFPTKKEGRGNAKGLR